MTRQRHYHPLAALRFLRKAVVVCLLPLANALLEFSLNAHSSAAGRRASALPLRGQLHPAGSQQLGAG